MERGPGVKAVIFDLDGTLIDSAAAVGAYASQLMAELELPAVSLDESRVYVGNGAARFLERALEARGRESTPALFERFMAFYAAGPAEANRPYEGADALLRRLSAEGIALALCTNKPGGPTEKVLRHLGWLELFGAVVAGDTLPEKKPDPAPLRFAAERLGVDFGPGGAVYVGDSDVDADTAEAAGAPFFLHLKGYNRRPLAETTHTAAFDDFTALPALIAERAWA